MITKRNSERSQKDCKICSSQFQTTFISNHPYKLFSCSSIQWRIIKSNPKRTNVNGRKIGDIDFVRVQRSQKDCKRTSCSSEFQTPLLFTDSLDSMKNCKNNGMKLRESVKKKIGNIFYRFCPYVTDYWKTLQFQNIFVFNHLYKLFSLSIRWKIVMITERNPERATVKRRKIGDIFHWFCPRAM